MRLNSFIAERESFGRGEGLGMFRRPSVLTVGQKIPSSFGNSGERSDPVAMFPTRFEKGRLSTPSFLLPKLSAPVKAMPPERTSGL